MKSNHLQNKIATVGYHAGVQIWDAKTGNPLVKCPGSAMNVGNAVAWSPDSKKILAIGRLNSVKVYNARTGKEEKVLLDATLGQKAFHWSPVGNVLSSMGHDGTIRFWDAKTARPREMLLLLPDNQHVVLNAHGRIVSSSSKAMEHLVCVVQTDQGQETLTAAEFKKQYPQQSK